MNLKSGTTHRLAGDLLFKVSTKFQNDMIALARKMTQIMHQMTEDTRGEGQLKTNKGSVVVTVVAFHHQTNK